MDIHDADQFKRLTIIALVSDDELFRRIVLKGRNALSIAHNLTTRASYDLDFSMEDQFDPAELDGIRSRIEFRLKQVFAPSGFVVFDVKLEARPEVISPEVESFWGGYSLEFKLISRRRYDELGGDLYAIRREAVPSRPGGKARIEIDISRHEYCEQKAIVQIDQFSVFVYTPTMIVCEKIRAICQQTELYAKFVKKHRARRARDFFDIHESITRFGIDLFRADTLEMLQRVFEAKRVPLVLLTQVEQEREFHRVDWDAVRDTVAPDIHLHEFEFYFDFVVDLCRRLASRLTPAP